MKYTQLQVREITTLPQETLRYWRKVLPPLMDKKGKTALFTAGDILALLIINEIVDVFGVNIAILNCVATAIFEQCQGIRWHQFKGKYLAIDPRAGKVTSILKDAVYQPTCGPVLLLDIEMLFLKLRDILTSDDIVQFALPFGPMNIPKNAARRR